jgi:hypothetical protein
MYKTTTCLSIHNEAEILLRLAYDADDDLAQGTGHQTLKSGVEMKMMKDCRLFTFI